MSKWEDRWRKKHGDFAVPCIVSERYLQFSDKGTQRIGAGEVLWVDVMTDALRKRPSKTMPASDHA